MLRLHSSWPRISFLHVKWSFVICWSFQSTRCDHSSFRHSPTESMLMYVGGAYLRVFEHIVSWVYHQRCLSVCLSCMSVSSMSGRVRPECLRCVSPSVPCSFQSVEKREKIFGMYSENRRETCIMIYRNSSKFHLKSWTMTRRRPSRESVTDVFDHRHRVRTMVLSNVQHPAL